MKSQEVNFQKSQKLPASRAGWESESDKRRYGVYVIKPAIDWSKLNE